MEAHRIHFIRSMFLRGAAVPAGSSVAEAAADMPSDNEYRFGDWPASLHPELQQFLDSWLSKHGVGGRLPRREDIDPAEIPSLLPGITLLDVEQSANALRFKFRLLGTRHSFANQANFSGRYIEDVLTSDDLAVNLTAFMAIVGRRLPHYYRRGPITFRDRIYPGFERVMVPLSSDGATINMLLGHYIFVGAKDNWHWWRSGG